MTFLGGLNHFELNQTSHFLIFIEDEIERKGIYYLFPDHLEFEKKESEWKLS